MAVTIEQRPEESREEGENGYVEYQYNAIGSDTVADIKAAADLVVPSSVSGFPRQPYRYERKGENVWIVYAKFQKATQSPPPIQSTDGWVYSYDTGETTVRVTHGLAIAQSGCNGNTAPDVGVAINVTDEGVEGIDVPVAAARLSRKGIFLKSAVSAAWLRSMAKMAFRTNDAPWNSWAANEVLYRKTIYVDRLDGYVEITQEFDVGENVTETFAGSDLSLTKHAHDYRWVMMQRKEDATAKRITVESVAAYVSTVFKELDFTELEPS